MMMIAQIDGNWRRALIQRSRRTHPCAFQRPAHLKPVADLIKPHRREWPDQREAHRRKDQPIAVPGNLGHPRHRPAKDHVEPGKHDGIARRAPQVGASRAASASPSIGNSTAPNGGTPCSRVLGSFI